MSRYQRHREKWSDCEKCALSDVRSRVVLVRGKLPADLLFVGEAPGASEDVLGKPFVGPAGKLLDSMLEQALKSFDIDVRVAITNIIGCIPLLSDDENRKRKVSEPPVWAIRKCRPRLLEVIDMAQPKIVVGLGKIADEWLHYSGGARVMSMIHPAAILRMDISQRALCIQREVVKLVDVIDDLKLSWRGE